MRDTLIKFVQSYDYRLPKELIAQEPAVPRDAARLLIYDRKTGKTAYDVFANLDKYLPPNAVLVFNETRVVPARLPIIKETGGRALALFVAARRGLVEVLCEKKLSEGSIVTVSKTELRFRVKTQKGSIYFLKPFFPIARTVAVLKKYGLTPLPPYIKHSLLTEKERREKYQTVFAREGISVAAPTASLHFTARLMRKLRNRGIALKFVRLDVGLGTFAPLTAENLATGKLHEEYYKIDRKTADFLNKAKKEGRPIIPVGTTALRTLESAAIIRVNPRLHSRESAFLRKLSGKTRLFVRKGYKFKFVDSLITNFHVPRSSLLMLVAALVGRKKILELYKKAIRRKFRLFSFGDGMLIK